MGGGVDLMTAGDPIRRAQAALREALARLRVAGDEHDSDRVFAASTETAMWCTALDDLLQKADAEYEERRDADAGGRIVRGLRFARNVGVHRLLAVHLWEQRPSSPSVSSSEAPKEARWRPRDELEQAPWRNPDNETAYDDYVAGRAVLDTVTAAQDFLWMRAMPLPPGTGSQPWLPSSS